MMNITEILLHAVCRGIWGVQEKTLPENFVPKKILVIRPHNQLGDMIAGTVLFRAMKESWPDSDIYLIASPQNISGAEHNPFLAAIFNFDKKKLFDAEFLRDLYRFLKQDYDLVLTPVVVSISFTSNLLAGIANGRFKTGPKSLDGMENDSAYFFHERVVLDFRADENLHVWDRMMRNLGSVNVQHGELKPDINYTEEESANALEALKSAGWREGQIVLGIHPGAGKPPNIWPAENFAEVINRLTEFTGQHPERKEIFIVATGSKQEQGIIDEINSRIQGEVFFFTNRTIAEVAALMQYTDLFIANDTGIMHVAGAESVPQISLFGMTNPHQWAPRGENKYWLRESDNISDILPEQVISLARQILQL
ncbi:MAG: glycosyltransferase family 9 protein [Ignavibacteriaceae bacterium]|nr:glycosyltransferase family 9 protein [Ignavibacteriaceae bacterium]